MLLAGIFKQDLGLDVIFGASSFIYIIAGFLISLLGGSSVQIGGPAGAFIVIVYGIVERYGLANLLISTACAGVLLFTTRRKVRGAYQTMFARGLVRKTYLAQSSAAPHIDLPTVIRSRIIKQRSRLQAFEEPGEPNAETLVRPKDVADTQDQNAFGLH